MHSCSFCRRCFKNSRGKLYHEYKCHESSQRKIEIDLMNHFNREWSDKNYADELLNKTESERSLSRDDICYMAFDHIDFDYIEEEDICEVNIDVIFELIDFNFHPNVLGGLISRGQAEERMLRKLNQDGERNGRVTYEQLQDYYIDIGVDIIDDSHYELMIRRMWNVWEDGFGKGTSKLLISDRPGYEQVFAILNDGSQRVIDIESNLAVHKADK